MRLRPLLAAVLLALALSGPALAQSPFTHIVRSGETLASIAQRYYGDPRRETVLVTENGLDAQGVPIVVGLRLVVPSVAYHRVRAGETWASIAERYYGDARRAFVLVEANHGSQDQPSEGAELVIPYPLRHVAGPSDTVQRLAAAYYGTDAPENIARLRRFNGLGGNHLDRGQIVLVPLVDLTLSEEGKRLVVVETGHAASGGEIRALQESIAAQLPGLGEHVRRGRYVEAIALGHRLLGTGQLTGNQVVTIQRELGTAFVAIGREDLAVRAFRAALQRQPDLELDSVRTSPVVMRAFLRAKEEEAAARRAPRR